jgi:hypothetical protein
VELVGPSDPGYDRLRAVFDSRVERRPAMVARCFSAGDVGLALELAASRGRGFAELDAATSAHGLAVTGGRVSWMGVAGVALGEGSGWLERALGPTRDSVVTVDATGVVVSSLTLRLAPVEPSMLCGFLTFPSGRAREVAMAYRDLMAEARAVVGGALTLYAGRAGGCQVAFCFLGSVDEGAAWLRPLRALGPSLDAVSVNPTPRSRP